MPSEPGSSTPEPSSASAEDAGPGATLDWLKEFEPELEAGSKDEWPLAEKWALIYASMMQEEVYGHSYWEHRRTRLALERTVAEVKDAASNL